MTRVTVVACSILSASLAAAITVPEVGLVGRCQKQIASAGASYAQKVIKANLKCTNAVTECQIQCDYGVFGPPCDTSGPPCCDSDDPGSNAAFGECMDDADAQCATQASRIALYEVQKQTKITNACGDLTVDQLCGAQGTGLNFATMAAGCQALIPGWTCDLDGILECVGGPLQQTLAGQITTLLDPRAPEGLAAIGSAVPGIPVTRKFVGAVAAGRADVWSVTGQAGDVIDVRVKTRNDTGTGQATLQPVVTLLGTDGTTALAEVTTGTTGCPFPSACGTTCPQAKRTLPFSGTFFARISGSGACTAGGYRLIVTTASGTIPQLVGDDVPAP